MKYFVTFFSLVTLFACSSSKDEKVHATRLDSLFNFYSMQEPMNFYTGAYSGSHGVAILNGTIDEVQLNWYDFHPFPSRLRPSDVSVKMPLTDGRVSSVSKRWKTKSGILPGITLREVQKLNGEFQLTYTQHSSLIDGDNLWHLEYKYQDTLYYKICFDKGEGNASLKQEAIYKSTDDQIQNMNPRVYAISLARAYSNEDKEAEENAANDEKTALARESGDSTMIEQVVPFIDFFTNYISTSKLPLLTLPFDQAADINGILTNDSPEGAFKNRQKENDKIMLIGLLPDTSNYYGIVWRKKPYFYIINGPKDFYNTFVTTFSKDGKILANVLTHLDKTEEDPTSCRINTETTGVINTDLSFFSSKLMHLNCPEDDGGKHDEVESVSGQVNKDGTITYKLEERHKQEIP